MQPQTSAHILTPPKTHGGFHKLCEALERMEWGDVRLTIGTDMPRDWMPDLTVVSMGTDRAADFGIARLHTLSTMNIPSFGFFATAPVLRKGVAANAHRLLGDRVKFAVLAGLDLTPTDWPDLRTIRVSAEVTGTDIASVAAAFRSVLVPRIPVAIEEEPPRKVANA